MGQIYRPSLDQPTDSGQYVMPPCTKVDPDLFTEYRTRRAAKRICMSCPIRNACLVRVLCAPVDPGGVYGGLSERDRANLRRRVACGES